METFTLVLRVALSLAVVLGLLWVLQKRFAKSGARRAAHRLTVVGRQSLGRRASVVLVETDGHRLLLGVTDHAVSVLHSTEVPSDDVVTLGAAPDTAQVVAPRHLEVVRERRFANELHAASAAANEVDAAAEPSAHAHLHNAPLPGAHLLGAHSPAAHGPLPLRPRRNKTAPASPVAGSILSLATWKQTAAAIRQVR